MSRTPCEERFPRPFTLWEGNRDENEKLFSSFLLQLCGEPTLALTIWDGPPTTFMIKGISQQ
jgi:hypothetical protein